MLVCGLIWLSHFSLQANENRFLEFSLSEISFDDGKVERYFQVFTEDYERFIIDLEKLLNAPTKKDNPGIFSWNNVAIEGLGKGIVFEVQDGLLESDKANRTACWTVFADNESKTERLKRMTKNDARMMKIYLKDANGKDLLGDYDTMKLIKRYFESNLG